MKKKIICLVFVFLFVFGGCATTKEVVYRDLPPDYVAVKKETLEKLVDELIFTRHQLLECWEKLRQ